MGKNNNSYTASYKIKVISFAELLEYNPDQDLHQKKSAYFTHPDFSAAKIKKNAQITRASIRYIYIYIYMYIACDLSKFKESYIFRFVFFKTLYLNPLYLLSCHILILQFHFFYFILLSLLPWSFYPTLDN